MDLEKTLGKLKNRKGILAIYLFGSHARGTPNAKSDIDICIIPDKRNEEERQDIDLIIDISKDFSDTYDFVNFYRLPIQIKYRVYKEGQEFFSKNQKLVNLIKFQTIKEYIEMKPMLERMYKSILEQGKKHG
ncbi:MAG: nucleotidyltransferase domain-containing protein [Candidatus Micrarchaeota archaeon]|nr:nucleotidyltransferase domain-containing protein [Candidatus Micrarchaeota archaeon]